MRLYYSGLGGAQKYILDFVVSRIENPRALVSYAMPSQLETLLEYGFTSLFLDSGAFSTFNSGVEINIDDFVAWAKEREDLFDIMANLDVIGDYTGSVKNFQYIRSKDLDVWPVYHLGEPVEVLHEYMAETDHLCVGGIASGVVNSDSIRRGLEWMYDLYPNMRLHVFGVNAPGAVMSFPVYSCDALTWRSGSRFGDAIVNGRRYKVGRIAKRNSTFWEVRDHIIDVIGLDISEEKCDWKQLDLYNIVELYNILEVEHSKIDFSTRVTRQWLF